MSSPFQSTQSTESKSSEPARRGRPFKNTLAAVVAFTGLPGVYLNDQELAVLKALRKHGPMTTHRIAEVTGMTVVAVSPRIKPLRDKGLVESAGVREEGRGVWRAIEITAQKQ